MPLNPPLVMLRGVEHVKEIAFLPFQTRFGFSSNHCQAAYLGLLVSLWNLILSAGVCCYTLDMRAGYTVGWSTVTLLLWATFKDEKYLVWCLAAKNGFPGC